MNGTEGFKNKLKYASAPTLTADADICTKVYADGIALAGAPDAATGTKGVTKLTTAPVSPTEPIAVGATDVATTGASKVLRLKSDGLIDDANLALTSAGDLPYSDGTDLKRLAKGTTGLFLEAGASAPAWGGANLAEANTFFGLTDITGTEAETLTAGGDASTAHHHELALNLQGDLTHYQSYVVWSDGTEVSGGGCSASSIAGGRLYTAAAAALGVAARGTTIIQSQTTAGKDVELGFWAKFAETGASALRVGSVGFYEDADDAYDVDTAAADGFVRLAFEAGAIQFQTTANANASREATTLSGITATNWNYYRIVFDQGTNAKCYVNGTLKATHATSLPVAAMPWLVAGAQGDNVSASTMQTYVSNAVFRAEI